MLTQKDYDEIKKFEAAGFNVTFTGSNGKLEYSTQGSCDDKYCDSCEFLRLLPDPDPFDWFRDGNMKAVCFKVNGLIMGALERPSEWTNIHRPLFCPKLGRELSEEEKVKAAEMLKYAQERFKR